MLYWWLYVFLEFMQQWLPRFAEVESPISVDVIWMHLNFLFSILTSYVRLNFIVRCSYLSTVRCLIIRYDSQPANYI